MEAQSRDLVSGVNISNMVPDSRRQGVGFRDDEVEGEINP
jgi:hypothetical protein